MTGITLDATVATGPPIGSAVGHGAVGGDVSAATAGSAGPFTADALPFGQLLALLTTTPTAAPEPGSAALALASLTKLTDAYNTAPALTDAAVGVALPLSGQIPIRSHTAAMSLKHTAARPFAFADAAAADTAPRAGKVRPPASRLTARPVPVLADTAVSDATVRLVQTAASYALPPTTLVP